MSRYTVSIYAWCRYCQANRVFRRISLAGYACNICGKPKPQHSPILHREYRYS